MTAASKKLPSARWKSFEGWDYNGMKQRLEQFMATVSKAALLEHVERVSGKTAKMSEPFSAGQYWCCFEFILDDHNLVIARVRLPQHPDSNKNTIEDSDSDSDSDLYAIQCEVATMEFLQNNATTVPAPKLYTYEPPASQQALIVGACYMLIEGFYGNTLQDVEFDICNLPMHTQDHIIAQWTSIQAELATFSFAQIGSISRFSKEGNGVATIGPLVAAVAECFPSGGPFTTSLQYFTAVGKARYTSACRDASKSDRFLVLGTFVFCDIVSSTGLFTDKESSFHLNHMDMGTQNILVDDSFNFLAIIDWEFAQTAPVQVNHHPMPFPLISSSASTQGILQNPEHLAFCNVSRQTAAQKLYQQRFQDAEQNLEQKGKPVHPSIADGLQGPASRIYAILEKLGGFWGTSEELTYEMVRLAFGFQGDKAKACLEAMEMKMNGKKD